jgi:diaminohydroxyphosphoribosylaminopyrimidine deaminase/5-amino-6-(5-phosphoribosylamino)uracil reductase
MDNRDKTWMTRALNLAEKGRGYVEPNPLVGAVVVQGDRLFGEGWHERFGEAHAEVNALNQACAATTGATLYVTLEPCCHYGKTPPCTEAIQKAGIKRVVAAMSDPFPHVAGKGAARLREAGVIVDLGVMESQAQRMNAPYLKLLRTGWPYVHAKWAMTLDGKIATRTGDSRWITGEGARRHAHELRGRMDAVIVGIGTVLADNPRLTVRPPGPRTPVRIVLDSHGRLPDNCQLAATAREAPVLVVTVGELPPSASKLRAQGCEILTLPSKNSRPDITKLLDDLGRRQMTNVLVEGGSEVLGSFFDGRAVDEVHAFIAPRIAGGKATTAVAGYGVEQIADAFHLADWQVERIDTDVLIHGLVTGEW